MEDKSKTKRRWSRYSLRSLMLLVTIAGVGFGWFAQKLRETQRQREAVAAIRELGGLVLYDYTYAYDIVDQYPSHAPPPGPMALQNILGADFFASVVGVDSNSSFRTDGPSFSDAVLEHVGELTQLKFLALGRMRISDAGLLRLRGLTQLNDLRLSDTQVTDAGLVHLQGLSQLKSLRLANTHSKDAGLAHLHGLLELEVLDLTGTKITDAGLIHLRGLTNLKHLFVKDTPVTDAGLIHLHGHSQLEVLNLVGTQVTGSGYQELQKALPNLWIWK